MGQRIGAMTVVRDRVQWGSYGFIAGLVIGLILGWLFNRVVGTVLWVGLVVVVLVLAFTVWRWVTDRGRQIEGLVEERRSSLRSDRADRDDGRDRIAGGDDDAVDVDSYVVERRPSRAVRTEPEER